MQTFCKLHLQCPLNMCLRNTLDAHFSYCSKTHNREKYKKIVRKFRHDLYIFILSSSLLLITVIAFAPSQKNNLNQDFPLSTSLPNWGAKRVLTNQGLFVILQFYQESRLCCNQLIHSAAFRRYNLRFPATVQRTTCRFEYSQTQTVRDRGKKQRYHGSILYLFCYYRTVYPYICCPVVGFYPNSGPLFMFVADYSASSSNSFTLPPYSGNSRKNLSLNSAPGK